MIAALRRWMSLPDHVVGINQRNVELVYAYNPRRNYRFADDKLLAKQLLVEAGVSVPETLLVCEGLHAIEPALLALANHQQFVVKPASSSGGQGILVVGERLDAQTFRRASGAVLTRDALRQHVASIVFGAFSDDVGDRAYVERRVIAHPRLHALWTEGLCDIRVITLEARPVMAMLRVPTRRSDGRANLHQGALGLAIDLGTGEVCRALSQGHVIQAHPDSGEPLLGMCIPSWAQVLETAARAARAIPLGYLGVDLVINEGGEPLVLEVNARPGLEIQNVNGRGLVDALVAMERAS